MKKYSNWSEYLQDQPAMGKVLLSELRDVFESLLPYLEESWGYGVPAYNLIPNAKLKDKIMFAGYANHIAIYPGEEVIQVFKEQLKPFKTSKGTIQIQHHEKLPVDLIKSIIEFKCKQYD